MDDLKSNGMESSDLRDNGSGVMAWSDLKKTGYALGRELFKS